MMVVHIVLEWARAASLSWTSSGDILVSFRVVSFQGHGRKKVYVSQLLGTLNSSTLGFGRSCTPVSVFQALSQSLVPSHGDMLELVNFVIRY